MIWNTVHTIENTAGDVIQFDFYNFKSEVGAVLGNDNSSGAYLDNCFTGENPQGISKTDALVTAMRQRSLKLN